jgi:NAD(P)-dependent dehydrogenase (short-subunit alcohol dehydrogenase family)
MGLMRALKQECAKLSISISAVAPAITVTPILTGNNMRLNAPPDVYAREMASKGVPINRPESVALAVCWLFNEGGKANGAGIFVQADKFVESREQWMGKEMLDLFRGGRAAPLFARLEGEAKPKM